MILEQLVLLDPLEPKVIPDTREVQAQKVTLGRREQRVKWVRLDRKVKKYSSKVNVQYNFIKITFW